MIYFFFYFLVSLIIFFVVYLAIKAIKRGISVKNTKKNLYKKKLKNKQIKKLNFYNIFNIEKNSSNIVFVIIKRIIYN